MNELLELRKRWASVCDREVTVEEILEGRRDE